MSRPASSKTTAVRSTLFALTKRQWGPLWVLFWVPLVPLSHNVVLGVSSPFVVMVHVVSEPPAARFCANREDSSADAKADGDGPEEAPRTM